MTAEIEFASVEKNNLQNKKAGANSGLVNGSSR
jgi:hypothetical protein